MMKNLRYSAGAMLLVAASGCLVYFGLRVSQHLPHPPPEMEFNLPANPDWWSSVQQRYDDRMGESNAWEYYKALESQIKQAVTNGISPTQPRRELIKFLSAYILSTNLVNHRPVYYVSVIAYTYSELGDYKRAAKVCQDFVRDDPNYGLLGLLADEYVRLGETNRAIAVHEYITKVLPGEAKVYDRENIALHRLKPTTFRYVFHKPDWWDQYNDDPPWLDRAAATLPVTTCFDDARDYIWSETPKDSDPRWRIAADLNLLDYKPLLPNEEELVLLGLCRAYADAGDSHRAIKWYWRIPEKYPDDKINCEIALRLMAVQFEKLGDVAHAKELRRQITKSDSDTTN